MDNIIDSIIYDTLIIIDTIYTDVGSGHVNDSANIGFNWWTTLLSALIGAIVALGFKFASDYTKEKNKLKTKKRLIVSDLTTQKGVLVRLRELTIELYNRFENRNISQYSVDAFEDLYIDIYDSIDKTDYFKMYGQDITELVKIYKAIEFLKNYSLDYVYSEYLRKITDNHNFHKRDTSKSEYYKDFERYLNSAKNQLKNNLDIINQINIDIDKFISKYS